MKRNFNKNLGLLLYVLFFNIWASIQEKSVKITEDEQCINPDFMFPWGNDYLNACLGFQCHRVRQHKSWYRFWDRRPKYIHNNVNGNEQLIQCADCEGFLKKGTLFGGLSICTPIEFGGDFVTPRGWTSLATANMPLNKEIKKKSSIELIPDNWKINSDELRANLDLSKCSRSEDDKLISLSIVVTLSNIASTSSKVPKYRKMLGLFDDSINISVRTLGAKKELFDDISEYLDVEDDSVEHENGATEYEDDIKNDYFLYNLEKVNQNPHRNTQLRKNSKTNNRNQDVYTGAEKLPRAWKLSKGQTSIYSSADIVDIELAIDLHPNDLVQVILTCNNKLMNCNIRDFVSCFNILCKSVTKEELIRRAATKKARKFIKESIDRGETYPIMNHHYLNANSNYAPYLNLVSPQFGPNAVKKIEKVSLEPSENAIVVSKKEVPEIGNNIQQQRIINQQYFNNQQHFNNQPQPYYNNQLKNIKEFSKKAINIDGFIGINGNRLQNLQQNKTHNNSVIKISPITGIQQNTTQISKEPNLMKQYIVKHIEQPTRLSTITKCMPKYNEKNNTSVNQGNKILIYSEGIPSNNKQKTAKTIVKLQNLPSVNKPEERKVVIIKNLKIPTQKVSQKPIKLILKESSPIQIKQINNSDQVNIDTQDNENKNVDVKLILKSSNHENGFKNYNKENTIFITNSTKSENSKKKCKMARPIELKQIRDVNSSQIKKPKHKKFKVITKNKSSKSDLNEFIIISDDMNNLKNNINTGSGMKIIKQKDIKTIKPKKIKKLIIKELEPETRELKNAIFVKPHDLKNKKIYFLEKNFSIEPKIVEKLHPIFEKERENRTIITGQKEVDPLHSHKLREQKIVFADQSDSYNVLNHERPKKIILIDKPSNNEIKIRKDHKIRKSNDKFENLIFLEELAHIVNEDYDGYLSQEQLLDKIYSDDENFDTVVLERVSDIKNKNKAKNRKISEQIDSEDKVNQERRDSSTNKEDLKIMEKNLLNTSNNTEKSLTDSSSDSSIDISHLEEDVQYPVKVNNETRKVGKSILGYSIFGSIVLFTFFIIIKLFLL